jgi:hypothetical protein
MSWPITTYFGFSYLSKLKKIQDARTRTQKERKRERKGSSKDTDGVT